MPHAFRSQRGSAVLMAVMGMMLLGGIGATTISVTSKHEESRAQGLAAEQAFGLAQAGIEYAKNRLDMGLNPVVQNFPMGEGTFMITTVPNVGTIVSTGQVGTTRKTLTLTSNYGKNCISLDLAGAHSAGPNLEDLKIKKTCLTQATVSAWSLSWLPDLGERTDLMQVRGDQLYTLYNNPAGYASGTVIDAADFIVNGGNIPINKIRFLQALPNGKSYTITMYFADGSSATGGFVDP